MQLGVHMSNCPLAGLPLPQPTAYERDQQALRDRVERLEQRADGNAYHTHNELAPRLNAALRRIEHLELEVARLKGPQSSYVQAIDQKLQNIRQSASSILGGELPTHLGCGCPGPWCNGHQFLASPAAAYPPVPDEPTV